MRIEMKRESEENWAEKRRLRKSLPALRTRLCHILRLISFLYTFIYIIFLTRCAKTTRLPLTPHQAHHTSDVNIPLHTAFCIVNLPMKPLLPIVSNRKFRHWATYARKFTRYFIVTPTRITVQHAIRQTTTPHCSTVKWFISIWCFGISKPQCPPHITHTSNYSTHFMVEIVLQFHVGIIWNRNCWNTITCWMKL